jgi:hypothetical protein
VGVGAAAGAGGSAAHGDVGGAGGAGGAGSAGSAGNAGSASNAAACELVKTDYAAELDANLDCNPNAASQCAGRVAAAPGCECRIFMQPADPFAIEHLSNVASGWFSTDCSMPSCPAKCSTAVTGTCQAQPNTKLGGRCVTP